MQLHLKGRWAKKLHVYLEELGSSKEDGQGRIMHLKVVVFGALGVFGGVLGVFVEFST